MVCHTGNPESIRSLFQRVRSELGQLDILVNNAATNPYFGPATAMMIGLHASGVDRRIAIPLEIPWWIGYRCSQWIRCFNARDMLIMKGLRWVPMAALLFMTLHQSGAVSAGGPRAGSTDHPAVALVMPEGEAIGYWSR